MILVTGATGANGIELIQRFSSAGAPIRAVARKPSKDPNSTPLGVEFVAADFDDPKSLRKALNGIDRAFLVTNHLRTSRRNSFVSSNSRALPVSSKCLSFAVTSGEQFTRPLPALPRDCRRRHPRVGHAIHESASQPLHAESAAGLRPIDPVAAAFSRLRAMRG
jgi:hypothetical protein